MVKLIKTSNKYVLNISNREVIGQEFKLRHGIKPTDKKKMKRLKKILVKRLKKEKKQLRRIAGKEQVKKTRIQIQSYYENLEWVGGYAFQMNQLENLNLYNLDDHYGGIDEAGKLTAIYITYYEVETMGGDDPHNDCLFNSINQALNFTIKTLPRSLKKHLKLKRNSKIDIERLDEVEKYFKVAINVSGDIIRQTTNKKYQKIVYLKLLNGHYTFNQQTGRHLTKFYNRATQPRKRMIVGCIEEKTKIFKIYDGITEQTITHEEYMKLSTQKIYESDVGFHPKPNNKMSLIEYYDWYIKMVVQLNDISNGRLNLMCFRTINDLAFYILDINNKNIEPEPLDHIEATWINECFTGGLIKHSKYEGDAYKYDYSSYYPSIMSSKKTFPIKKGSFSEITMENIKEKGYINYGIYHCKISNNTGNKNKNMLFKFNNLFNKYTHLDLQTAIDLNFDIEFMEGVNALLYIGNDVKAKGYTMFNDGIDYLYHLKKESVDNKPLNKFINSLLQRLWGLLSSKKILSKYANVANGEFIELPEDITFNTCIQHKDLLTVKYADNNKIFKTNYARIAPFMTGFGRRGMYDLLKNNIDNIKHIHTDGVIVNTPLKYKKDDEELIGHLKFENKGYVEIQTQHMVNWK